VGVSTVPVSATGMSLRSVLANMIRVTRVGAGTSRSGSM
jgi:hypothetical protein